MNKYYVGQLSMAYVNFNHTVTPATVELKFKNGDLSEEMPFKLNHEYYVVEKAELDALEARKEKLETTKGTPEWYLSNRLKQLAAENAELRANNKSLGEENSKLVEKNKALKDTVGRFFSMTSVGEELRAANEKLAAKVADLNERINHLEVILEHDENRMAVLITENNKLRGTNNELNAVIVQLRDNEQRNGYL